MEKIIKKYVEYLVPELVFNKGLVEEINHNDPKKIIDLDNEGIMGFRFFDKEFVLDGKKSYEGDIENRSNWYLLGTKLSGSEVLKYFKNRSDLFEGEKCINKSPYHVIFPIYEDDTFCITETGIILPVGINDVVLSNDENINKIEEKDFNKLKRYIGKEVTCERLMYGKPYLFEGVLEDVISFDKIVLSNRGYDFLNYGEVISSIKLSKNDKEIYKNPYIEMEKNTKGKAKVRK